MYILFYHRIVCNRFRVNALKVTEILLSYTSDMGILKNFFFCILHDFAIDVFFLNKRLKCVISSFIQLLVLH